MKTLLLLSLLSGIATACQGSNFAGDTARAAKKDKPEDGSGPEKTHPDDEDTDTGDEPGGEDPDDDDSDGSDKGTLGSDADGNDGNLGQDEDLSEGGEGLETDEEVMMKPQKCIVANVKFTPSDGEKCPEHYAAYTADDGKSPHLGCCPLPARDILDKEPPQLRGTNCMPDEVATGVSGGGLLCTKINTAKYKLGAATKSCYVGDGASGGQGSAGCGTPPDTLGAMVTRFGSDACIGVPFGALIVGRTGKYCTDVTSSQLLFIESGQPVQMYE